MNQKLLRNLLSQVVWIALFGAVTLMSWTSAVHALPGVETSGQTISATSIVPVPLNAGESSVGPAEIATVTIIDPNTFPTPSPEEIATREAALNNTYLPGPSTDSPAGPQGVPPPNSETTVLGADETVQTLIKKAPAQTGLAVVGSSATLYMLTKFLFGLVLLMRGR